MMRVLHTAIAVLTMLALAQPALAQADREAQAATSARELAEAVTRLAAERTQRFRVVLIVSSTMAEPPADNIPTDARKALEDMKAFLPFKSYRLFGTGEVDARRGEPATLRITGGDSQTLDVTIAREARPLVYTAEVMRGKIQGNGNGPMRVTVIRPNTADSRLSLTFMLRDASDLSPSVPGGRAVFEGPSINTLVTMDVGETIVVGTSRVKGSRGLLALLTALPNP